MATKQAVDLAADRLPPWERNPGQLVSLEVMVEVGSRCVRVIEQLVVRECELSRDDRKALMLRIDCEEARDLCREMGFGSAAAQADRIRHGVERFFDQYTTEQLRRDLESLRRQMVDEIKTRLFLHVPPADVDLYLESEPFGAAVGAAFPSAIHDVREAAICLALDRSTACVLHLMRVLELCIKRGINPRLKIELKGDRKWADYIGAIRNRVKNKPRLPGIDWQLDEPFYDRVADDLDNIRAIWRNPTMHAAASYQPRDARSIFGFFHSFMEHLATRVKEEP